MKAQSLRIGNLIWSNDGHFDRVEDFVTEIESNRIGTKCSKLPYMPIENIEPIPLTEEWLVKFGFERIYKSFIHSTYIAKNMSYYFWHENKRQYADFKGNEIDCLYVHQLQNLYFAITGTELTLTEQNHDTTGTN